MKAGDTARVRALRKLAAELQVAATSGRRFDEVAVIKSYAGALRASAEEYEQLGVEDRAEAVRAELAVVEEFLPAQMSRPEIEELVGRIIGENQYGPRDLGKVMKAVMSGHGDVVDGRTASEVARELLSRSG
jgi:uncharacterized protein YqeY